MQYLLDSNSFIQPKNTFYSFEVCPAYWEWLIDANKRGVVFSIERIEAELMGHQDELSKWAKQCGDGFFLKPDGGTGAQLPVVAQWVQDQPNYTNAARQQFFGVADYYLIAQARASAFTVVTFEKAENSPNKVKIPNVCTGVGVKCCNLFQMLKAEGARF